MDNVERCRKYYREHQKALLAQKREYWQDHGKEILAKRVGYYQANKELWRRSQLKRDFGITLEEYDQMWEEQGGVCAICGDINRNGRRLSVDHDHGTGEIRGLLCNNCNHVLGNAHDDPEILRAAINYLDIHNGAD